jgi:predicted nucleic acid-binding protein
MIAIDTNLIVRYLANDHPKQSAQAQALIDRQFADALHLARCPGCDGFVTFDRRFARAANKLGGITVRLP